MNLGFYYHIEYFVNNNKIYIPKYLGLFIDSLSKNVDQMFLIGYASINKEEQDYCLTSSNITFLSLGIKSHTINIIVNHKKLLNPHLLYFKKIDYLIVRSPSPLAPFFRNFMLEKKILYYAVGSYGDVANKLKIRSIRSILIYLLMSYMDNQFLNVIKHKDILVNSLKLYESYKSICKKVSFIPTSTLTKNDFFKRENTCNNNKIRLLYTGRFDVLQKGLLDLLEAFYKLIIIHPKYELHLVGWDSSKDKFSERKMKKIVENYKMHNNVFFHKKAKVGEELNKFYRRSDIFVLSSYHEGFPRTIWEAMANSLPIITTPVGGIPYILKNKENAVFVNVRKPDEIVDAIILLSENKSLRKKIISNAYYIALKNSVDKRSKEIIQYLKNRDKKN